MSNVIGTKEAIQKQNFTEAAESLSESQDFRFLSSYLAAGDMFKKHFLDNRQHSSFSRKRGMRGYMNHFHPDHPFICWAQPRSFRSWS